MYSHEMLREIHDEARKIKEYHWYQHQEPDLYPILAVRWRDMPLQTIDVAKVGGIMEKIQDQIRRFDTTRAHWLAKHDISTPLVIYSCLLALSDGVQLPGLEHMPPKDTPIEEIWLATEGYALATGDEEELNRLAGHLEQDYRTNPESKVHERLTTYTVETASTGLAEWGRVTSGFHKEDGGRIAWDEPVINTSEDFELGPEGHDKLLEIMMPHVTRENLT